MNITKSASRIYLSIYARSFFFIWIVFGIAACSDDVDQPAFQPEYLVDFEVVASIKKDDVLAGFQDIDFPVPGISFLIRYDVQAIRLTYKTVSYDDQSVIASGLLLVPDSKEAFPVISFQHGTIYDPGEAPSLMNSVYAYLGSFLAATGFITVLPDYLGYGESSGLQHPYQHRESLATATRDMIRASREYFKVEQLTEPKERIFLTGYSQGGFATLATLKLMQDEHPDEFSLVAATAGGGPYNKTASMIELLSADLALEGINTYLWVIDSYNRIYPELNRPYSFYLNEPWASMVEQNGVFAPVEMNPTLLFTDEFRNGVVDGSDTAFLNVLADNDVFAWRPAIPLQLYHGTDDMLVTYMNAVTAVEAMNMAGAANVELFTVEEGTHLSTFWDYLFGTFSFFLPLAFS